MTNRNEQGNNTASTTQLDPKAQALLRQIVRSASAPQTIAEARQGYRAIRPWAGPKEPVLSKFLQHNHY